MASHEILGGLIQVYKRGEGRFWQCSASIAGNQYRSTTKEEGLTEAKQAAEDWFLELRGKARAGLLKTEKTFKEAADQFLKEYPIITQGHRNPRWVEGHSIRLRLHLLPFFGPSGLSEVTPGKVQEFRVHRISTSRTGKAPARSTLHDEIVTLRQVLKTAVRHGWLSHLPDLSPPYGTQGKIVHRPWFSPAEYKQLYTATRLHKDNVPEKFKWNAEQEHDFVLFMANTGLRPDEAKNLEHRDVAIVDDDATGQRILEIDVRGKRGVGFCKSTPMAVQPYERLLARPKPLTPEEREALRPLSRKDREEYKKARPIRLPEPTDKVFPGNHIKMFNNILIKAKLKLDRDRNKRTAYSLRHTYICMRLIEGADIYALAKNCRTSVEMIQKFYAAHIKDLLDAAAINTMRPRHMKRGKKPPMQLDADQF